MPLFLPKFKQINPKTLSAALDHILATYQIQLAKLLDSITFTAPDWAFLQKLEGLNDSISRFWAPIRHLNAVCENETLRKAYQACLPKLSEWESGLHHNTTLYQIFSYLAAHPEFTQQQASLQKLIQNTLDDFRLAGVALDETKKEHYKTLQTCLSEQGTQFEINILESSEAGALVITNPHQLNGLPDSTLHQAALSAKAHHLNGWRFNLEEPVYHAVMTLAEDRLLRESMYRAWTIRASELTPAFNNTPLMKQILDQRSELSHLLGFEHYAALSLATDKMAKSAEEVMDFLTQLLQLAKPNALEELNELQKFAQTQGFEDTLSPWDLSYFSEKLRMQKFGSNEEVLRPYFPIDRVLEGLFKCLNTLFQLHFKPIQHAETWHPSVQVVDLYDTSGTRRGTLYLDLYARARKREGAWVDEAQSQRRLENGTLQRPIVFLTCNFSAPSSHQPSLLTHEDVITLFHEMGHALHHLLTQVEYAGISGTQGVPWDAVEFPSQFLECFAWEPEVLALISGHYQTGETLAVHHIEAIQKARLFQMSRALIRQLEFSLFDFSLHLKWNAQCVTNTQIQSILDEVRSKTNLMPAPSFNRFQNSFAHIFSDSYAAGYYSYLWAEVLAADAFDRFKVSGTLNAKIGKEFVQTILEPGGSVDILTLFEKFRGRAPSLEALLIQRGLT